MITIDGIDARATSRTSETSVRIRERVREMDGRDMDSCSLFLSLSLSLPLPQSHSRSNALGTLGIIKKIDNLNIEKQPCPAAEVSLLRGTAATNG
jgi:hypothetical protein